MINRRCFLEFSISLALLGPQAGLAATRQTLRLGTLPVVSTRTAYEIYQPLMDHLQSLLKRKVDLETPPNFKVMYQRVREQGFDILVSPPHIARLAQHKLGWQPLAMCQPEHQSILLVMQSNGPETLEGLRGKTIAVLDKSALVFMIMVDALAKQGLVAERDFNVMETRNYESSQIAVQQGIAQAMVARSQGFLDSNDRDRMRILFEAGSLPGYVVLAAPTLDKNEVELLRRDLPSFGGTAEAQTFLKKLGYDGLGPVSERTLKKLDPYLNATESSLK